MSLEQVSSQSFW